MNTTLNYLIHPAILTSEATVQSFTAQPDGTAAVVLDQTILYAQGGGQPSDIGTISSSSGVFSVQKVLFQDGIVTHYGILTSGSLQAGESVTISVDAPTRNLYTRLHSAGHLVDSAMKQAGQTALLPTKGYHFPQGPSVEYSGTLTKSTEELTAELTQLLASMIQQDFQTQVRLVTKEELAALCDFVPSYLPEGKPIRAVTVWQDDWIPCGGTHVNRISEIGTITIRKIKVKGDSVKVSYEV